MSRFTHFPRVNDCYAYTIKQGERVVLQEVGALVWRAELESMCRSSDVVTIEAQVSNLKHPDRFERSSPMSWGLVLELIRTKRYNDLLVPQS